MGYSKHGYRTSNGRQIIRTALIYAGRPRAFVPGELDKYIEMAEKGKLPTLRVYWHEELQRYVLQNAAENVYVEAAVRSGVAHLNCEVINSEDSDEDEIKVVREDA